MALTRVAAAGINTGQTFVLQNVNTSGIVTATGGFVGAVTGNVTGNLTGNITGNVSSSGPNTLGSLTVTNDATVGGALTVTGDLTVNGTTTTIDTAVTAVDSIAVDGAVTSSSAVVGSAVTINSSGINATGVITATSFIGDGSNLTGIDATQIVTGNTSVQTVDTGSDGHVKVNTEGTERLRINSSGKVGIGTDTITGQVQIDTSSANRGLTLNAPGNGTYITFEADNTAFGDIGSEAGIVGSGTNDLFALNARSTRDIAFRTNSAERLRITSSGNIGIGTDNPAAKLHLSDSSGALIINRETDSLNQINFRTLNTHRGSIGADSSACFTVYDSAAAEKLRITSSGNVRVPDSGKFTCGADDDLQIYHNGSHSYIDNKTGNLYIRANTSTDVGGDIHIRPKSGESSISCLDDAGVLLYYDNSQKLETTSGGIDITGGVSADGYFSLTNATNSAKVQVQSDISGNYTGWKEKGVASGSMSQTSIDSKTPTINDFAYPNSSNGMLIWSTSKIGFAAGSESPQYGTGVQMLFDSNGLALGNHRAFDRTDSVSSATQSTIRLYSTTGNADFDGTVTCDGLTCDGQIVAQNTAEYQVVVKDTNSNGTAAETGIAFRDSSDTTQAHIGPVASGNTVFYIFNDTNEEVRFGTNGTGRCKVNADGHFTPHANNTYDLGTTSLRWRNVYTNDLNLSNEGSTNDVDGTWGNYTIQEGEDDLFLINRRSGKKYKFMLQEVN